MAGTGIIRGKVVRNDGTAVANAPVWIYPSVKQITDTVGDAFRIDSVRVNTDTTGAFSATVTASDDLTLNPSGVTYTVAMPGLDAVPGVFVPSGGTVEMSDVASADPSAPVYAVQVTRSDFTTLAGRVTQLESHPSAPDLSGYATTTALTTGLASKADASALTTGLAGKVNTSTYTAGLAAKADQTAVDTLTARPRLYGKLNGRTIRGRAGGRSAFYATVTTPTTSFAANAVPLAEPFVSTGLGKGTDSVIIPAWWTPGALADVTVYAKTTGGGAAMRSLTIKLNGQDGPEFRPYGTSISSGGTIRIPLQPGMVLTASLFPETGSVSIIADNGNAVFLDVVAVDRPKVQPAYFGWSQTLAETATVATAAGKNEILSIFFPINSWNDVQGDSMATDTALTNFVTAYPDRAIDCAGPLIPHGLGSGTWDAALDAVTAGTYDGRFTTLGTNLAQKGPATVYYRPWWEFNISTAQPTQAKFIAAWNRAIPIIRAAFAAAAPTKTLKIMWCWSEGADPLPWYPADANVDVISGDIYAMVYGTTTPSLNQLADKVTVQLSMLANHGALKSKPIAISEFAQCAVQPGSTTFQGLGDTPSIMDLYFDFIENAAVLFAGYHNFSASGVGITLKDVPNTAARLEQRRALVSRLG